MSVDLLTQLRSSCSKSKDELVGYLVESVESAEDVHHVHREAMHAAEESVENLVTKETALKALLLAHTKGRK